MYYGINDKNDSEQKKYVYEQKTEDKKLNIDNIIVLSNNYNGKITQNEIKDMIHTFIYNDINTLYSQTKDNTLSQNEQYYEDHKSEISQMGIYSQDEFLMIAEDIKNKRRTQDIELKRIEIEVNNQQKQNNNDYYRFNLNLKYSTGEEISFKVDLANDISNKTKIKYYSNSEIAKLFENYKVSANKKELISIINNIIENVENINKDTKMKSLEKQSQIFHEKKALYEKMGIYNLEDYYKVVQQIKSTVDWSIKNELKYYKLDLDSITEDANYLNIILMIDYDYTQDLKLQVHLTKNNTSPSIKITGQNGE